MSSENTLSSHRMLLALGILLLVSVPQSALALFDLDGDGVFNEGTPFEHGSPSTGTTNNDSNSTVIDNNLGTTASVDSNAPASSDYNFTGQVTTADGTFDLYSYTGTVSPAPRGSVSQSPSSFVAVPVTTSNTSNSTSNPGPGPTVSLGSGWCSMNLTGSGVNNTGSNRYSVTQGNNATIDLTLDLVWVRDNAFDYSTAGAFRCSGTAGGCGMIFGNMAVERPGGTNIFSKQYSFTGLYSESFSAQTNSLPLGTYSYEFLAPGCTQRGETSGGSKVCIGDSVPSECSMIIDVVGPTPPGYIDLTMNTDSSWYLGGDQYNFRGSVQNIGTAPSPNPTKVRLDIDLDSDDVANPDLRFDFFSPSGSVPPGSTNVVDYLTTITAPGTHRFRYRANPDASFAENSYSNNFGSWRSFTVPGSVVSAPPSLPAGPAFVTNVILEASINGGVWQTGTIQAAHTDTVELRSSGTGSSDVRCNATSGTGFAASNAPINGGPYSVSTPALGTSDTFSIECTGSGGTDVDSVRIEVAGAPSVEMGAGPNGGSCVPTGGIGYSPYVITGADDIDMCWTSTNAGVCGANVINAASGASMSTGGAVIGRDDVSEPIVGEWARYQVLCTNSGGGINLDEIEVHNPVVVVDLWSNDGTIIEFGETIELEWDVTGNKLDDPVGACRINGPGIPGGIKTLTIGEETGTINVTVLGESDFTLTCDANYLLPSGSYLNPGATDMERVRVTSQMFET